MIVIKFIGFFCRKKIFFNVKASLKIGREVFTIYKHDFFTIKIRIFGPILFYRDFKFWQYYLFYPHKRSKSAFIFDFLKKITNKTRNICYN